MAGKIGLQRSILSTLAVLLVAQLAILAAVRLGYRLEIRRFIVSASVSVVYHVLLAAFLLWRRSDFRIRTAPEPLGRVNAANGVTMARLSSIPTAVFLVVWSRDTPLLPVVLPFLVAVFATDFLDGILARRRGEITVLGQYLDSVSDYLIIIATSVIFYVFRLVPLWFFVLILARLVLFALGMGYAALRQGKANTLSTFMGKASIFAVMLLYVLEVAESFHIPWIGDPVVVRVVEYAAAAVVAGSMVDKAIFLRRLLAGKVEDPTEHASARGGEA
jgi:phosphatidylglycerophosphate synthase